MHQLLRMVMALGGWRLIGRAVNRWADRGLPKDAAGRKAAQQRRRTAKQAMRGARMLGGLGRWMR